MPTVTVQVNMVAVLAFLENIGDMISVSFSQNWHHYRVLHKYLYQNPGF